jgi:hypothetical protein
MATSGQEVVAGDGEQEASTSPETCLGTSTASSTTLSPAAIAHRRRLLISCADTSLHMVADTI